MKKWNYIFFMLVLLFPAANSYSQGTPRGGIQTVQLSKYVDVSNYRSVCGDEVFALVAIRCGATFDIPYLIPRKNLNTFKKLMGDFSNRYRAAQQQQKIDARNDRLEKFKRKVKAEIERQRRAAEEKRRREEAERKKRNENIAAPAGQRVETVAEGIRGIVDINGKNVESIKGSDDLKRRANSNKGNVNVPITSVNSNTSTSNEVSLTDIPKAPKSK